MELFKLFGKIAVENDEANNSIDKTADKAEKASSKMQKAFEKIGNGFKTVGEKISNVGKKITAGTGLAITAIGALTKSSITAYADYEQLVGGVETLFGAGGKTIEEYARSVGKTQNAAWAEFVKLSSAQNNVLYDASQAYKTAGMSANEYMETVTSFSASLIASLKGDTFEAADYANRAVTDMADNANKMGTDMELIQNAYQGFAKQNYTMLDNLKLGYGGTQAEMQRLIKDASKLTGVQKELGVTVDSNSLSFGNIVNAISVVQKNMGIMGTTAEEAEYTISGSINSMKAAWTNFLVGMADDEADFEELIDNLLKSVEVVARNIIPRVEIVITTALTKVLEGIKSLTGNLPPVFGKVIDKLIDLVSNFRDLDDEQKKQVLSWIALVASIGPVLIAIGKVTSGFGTLFETLSKISSVSSVSTAIEGFVTACGGASAALGVVAVAIVAVIGVVIFLKEHWEQLVNTFKNFAQNTGLAQKLEEIKSKLQPLMEKLKGLKDLFEVIGGVIVYNFLPVIAILAGIFNAVVSWLSPAMDALGGLLDILSGIGTFIKSVFVGDWQSAGNALKQIWDGLITMFTNSWKAIGQFLIGLYEGIIGFFKGLLDAIGITQWLAETKTKISNWWNNLISSISNWWNNLVNSISNWWESLIESISNRLNNIKTSVSNWWDGVVSWLSSAWNLIVDVVRVGFEFIKSIIVFAFELITIPFRFIWENCKQYVFEAWEWIKEKVSSAINAVKDVISAVSDAIKAVVQIAWNWIKEHIVNPVVEAYNKVKEVVESIKSAVQAKFNEVKNNVTEIWTAIKTAISNKINEIKTAVSNKVNEIKSDVSNKFNEIKNKATEIWDGVKTAISNKINEAKSAVSNTINGIKSTVSNAFNNVKNTVSNIWNSIKIAIETPINQAKATVQNAINAIKNAFNFNWSLPHLNLPHISVSGGEAPYGIGGQGSLPKFNIQWYKKAMEEPVMFTEPTLFNYNPITGSGKGAGEAGDEMMYGKANLMRDITQAVESGNGSMATIFDYWFEKMFELFMQYFPEFAKAPILDVDETAARLTPRIDTYLNDEDTKRRRGN